MRVAIFTGGKRGSNPRQDFKGRVGAVRPQGYSGYSRFQR